MGDKKGSNIDSSTFERDVLAEHRTSLANERTVLAYTRTGLTFFVIGATFIKFFDQPFLEIIGWIFIPVGVVTLLKGIVSYRTMKRQIERARAYHVSP